MHVTNVPSGTPMLDWLDSDVCLAFNPVNVTLNDHPNYRVDTVAFGSSNEFFLEEFYSAYDVMSKLGVNERLVTAVDCDPSCSTEGEITEIVTDLITTLVNISAIGDQVLANQLAENAANAAAETTVGGEIDGNNTMFSN